MLNFMVNFGSKIKSAVTNHYFYILNFQKMKSCILTFEHPKSSVQCKKDQGRRPNFLQCFKSCTVFDSGAYPWGD